MRRWGRGGGKDDGREAWCGGMMVDDSMRSEMYLGNIFACIVAGLA